MTHQPPPPDRRPQTPSELIAEHAIVLLTFTAVTLICCLWQPRISLDEGRGADGGHYYEVAEQFSQGRRPLARPPWVYRIGTPLLASLAGGRDLLSSFTAVNVVAAGLSSLLLLWWLRLHMCSWWIRVSLCVLFITQWHAPTRFTWYYPAYVDPWAFVVMLLGLIGVHHARTTQSSLALAGLCGLSVVGVFFREVTLLIPFALLFAHNPIAFAGTGLGRVEAFSAPALRRFAPLVCGTAGLVLVRVLVTPSREWSPLLTAGRWLYERSVPEYIHGWFVAFGPILVALVYGWPHVAAFLRDHQSCLVFLAGTAALGYVGGTDIDRILYWGMPVVYLCIGKAIEKEKAIFSSLGLLMVLGCAQAISHRVLFPTPADWDSLRTTPLPVLTPCAADFSARDLYPFHGDRRLQAIALGQYAFLTGMLFLWLRRRARRAGRCGTEAAPNPQPGAIGAD